MAYMTKKELSKLCEAESYFWEHSDWEENKETEHALANIWEVVESMIGKEYALSQKMCKYMRKKRKLNKKYGRKKGEK